MGAPGHTLENCYAFHNRVQDLIEANDVTFTPRGSNVKNNHIPTHGGASINVIKEVNEDELIKKVEEIQTPIAMIRTQLLKRGLISVILIDKDDIKELKGFMQQMLD